MAQFNDETYKEFLTSKSAKQWKKIGVKRRAGVLAPLFSLYSNNSVGIGEIPDLNLLTEWCKKTGLSVIQLLPMNDTGFNFTPYDCQSTFALDTMYLSLMKIQGIDPYDFIKDIEKTKAKFEAGKKRVNYKIKGEKLKILWKMFSSIKKLPVLYEDFAAENSYWLNDYACYKVLKDLNEQKAWEVWPEKYKFKEDEAMEELQEKEFEMINFHMWLQWQAALQFEEVKAYANTRNVFLQGDLPFLVSRDSADVWAHQNYFKLNIVSGAPPDMYFAKGQRWGMPSYNWDIIEQHDFDYLKEKVKYAERFYDMFRIDHFVGLFRLWSIQMDEPQETYGLKGKFDPENEALWKEHGQKILRAMSETSIMLPCAEDLGVVPNCSYETLKEFSIPGMDVQRWARDWGKTYEFRKADAYRNNSIAVISSHDMNPLMAYWEEEVGTVDAGLVAKICEENGYNYNQVTGSLFDMAISTDKRLRWKKEVDTPEKAMAILGKSREQAWMFYDMHKEAYTEKDKFWAYLGLPGAPKDKADKAFVKAALQKASETKSIFSIQIIHDWLSLSKMFDKWKRTDMRINVPGSMADTNWSIVLPVSLEEMLEDEKTNEEIKKINIEGNRI